MNTLGRPAWRKTGWGSRTLLSHTSPDAHESSLREWERGDTPSVWDRQSMSLIKVYSRVLDWLYNRFMSLTKWDDSLPGFLGQGKFSKVIGYWTELSVFSCKFSTLPLAGAPNVSSPSNPFPHRMKNAVDTTLKMHWHLLRTLLNKNRWE